MLCRLRRPPRAMLPRMRAVERTLCPCLAVDARALADDLYTPRNILLTGGAGFIGPHVCTLL